MAASPAISDSFAISASSTHNPSSYHNLLLAIMTCSGTKISPDTTISSVAPASLTHDLFAHDPSSYQGIASYHTPPQLHLPSLLRVPVQIVYEEECGLQFVIDHHERFSQWINQNRQFMLGDGTVVEIDHARVL